MTTREKRIISGAAAILLTAGAVYWLVFYVAPTTSTPGFGFVGFTNSPTKGQLAQFRLTNSLGYPALFGVASAEFEVGGAWPASGVPTGVAMYRIPEGSISNVLVAVPTEGKRWRLPVVYARMPNRLEMLLRPATDLLGRKQPNWHSNTFEVFVTYASPAQP